MFNIFNLTNCSREGYDPETTLTALRDVMVTSRADGIKSRAMCQLDELKDYGNNTVLLMILSLFTSLMILSIYMNIRLLVILCHRFKKEQKYNYFPMLMLLNCLSMINELILFAGIFLPFVEIEKYHNIKYPFIYSLVTPSEIALADVLLCAQRIWLHKSDKKDTTASRWIPLVIFVFLCIPIGFVSFHSQLYTVTYEQERTNFLFACFLADNIAKGVFSTCSFVGYTWMFVWVKKRKIDHDTIIRQALPIAIFQLFVIGAQTFLEFQPNPKLSPHARIFLDICFSAACTVAVPFCIVIGDSDKRAIFYSTPCCCYCYCQPRPAPQITVQKEANSRAERQKMEEEAAIKERKQEKEKRRKQREMEHNFHNLDDSSESNESGV